MSAVAIYARHRDERLVERQLEVCNDLVGARLGLGEVSIFRDHGSALAFHRPGYEAMLTALAAGDVDTVVVADVDRLCRRPDDLLALTELLGSVGGKLIVGDDGPAELFSERALAVVLSLDNARQARRRRTANRAVASAQPARADTRRPNVFLAAATALFG